MTQVRRREATGAAETSALDPGPVTIEMPAVVARALQGVVDGYRADSTVEYAAILEEGGVVLVSSGSAAGAGGETIGVLAAAVFASLRALSNCVGEERFEGCFQHGADRHFHLCEVAPGFLLFSVFGKGVAPGLVSLYTAKAGKAIARELTRGGSGAGR